MKNPQFVFLDFTNQQLSTDHKILGKTGNMLNISSEWPFSE
jgi:hypothetical protein